MELTEPAISAGAGSNSPSSKGIELPGGPVTAQQLQQLAGIGTQAGIRRTLDKLAEHGLLSVSMLGQRVSGYELNRDHVLYPAIQALLSASKVLTERLTESISDWVCSPNQCRPIRFSRQARRRPDLRHRPTSGRPK